MNPIELSRKGRLILSEHNSFYHLSQSQLLSLLLKTLLNLGQEVILAIFIVSKRVNR